MYTCNISLKFFYKITGKRAFPVLKSTKPSFFVTKSCFLVTCQKTQP